jgi:hypothetical protein
MYYHSLVITLLRTRIGTPSSDHFPFGSPQAICIESACQITSLLLLFREAYTFSRTVPFTCHSALVAIYILIQYQPITSSSSSPSVSSIPNDNSEQRCQASLTILVEFITEYSKQWPFGKLILTMLRNLIWENAIEVSLDITRMLRPEPLKLSRTSTTESKKSIGAVSSNVWTKGGNGQHTGIRKGVGSSLYKVPLLRGGNIRSGFNNTAATAAALSTPVLDSSRFNSTAPNQGPHFANVPSTAAGMTVAYTAVADPSTLAGMSGIVDYGIDQTHHPQQMGLGGLGGMDPTAYHHQNLQLQQQQHHHQQQHQHQQQQKFMSSYPRVQTEPDPMLGNLSDLLEKWQLVSEESREEEAE